MEGVEVMSTNLLSSNKDPMGYAIADYHAKGKAGKLRVISFGTNGVALVNLNLFRLIF